MTTPPVDGEPPADMKDPTQGPTSGSAPADDDSRDDADSDSGDKDAMGIDDSDPIDATLVGEPVDAGDGRGRPFDSDADSNADSDAVSPPDSSS